MFAAQTLMLAAEHKMYTAAMRRPSETSNFLFYLDLAGVIAGFAGFAGNFSRAATYRTEPAARFGG
jgi:hypothetical protein